MSEKSDDILLQEYNNVVATLPTRAPIYLPTEKISLPDRVAGVKRVKHIYDNTLSTVHADRLRALREKYKGHDRAFIIGNGPSLNLTDLSRLKNEVTFCVNSFFLKTPELSWEPTFYVVEDHLVAEDRADQINSFHGPTKLFPAYLAYCLDEDENTIFYNHRPRVSYPHGFDFSKDAAKITYTGCTVTFSCMQLAHYLGFKELYLIGVDASYELPKDVKESTEYGVGVLDMDSDDPNHFDPNYFGKGYRWHDPQVDKMIEAYQEARKVTDKLGRPIYNAGIGGKLEVFERVNFSDVFPEAVAPSVLGALTDLPPGEKRKHLKKLEASADQAARKNAQEAAKARKKYPKLLVIDMTRIGFGTATGELKKTLLEDWPDENLMHVYSEGRAGYGVDAKGIPVQKYEAEQDVFEFIKKFDPDLVLYRPLADKPGLHSFAMQVIQKLNVPLVSWIMDDWLERLKNTNHTTFTKMEADTKAIFKRSNLALSICDAMSEGMEARYGVPFHAFANAVDPDDWPRVDRETDPDRPFIIRFSGGLADDMNLDTILQVARAVEQVNRTIPVRFEINSRQFWIDKQKHHFRRLKATTLRDGGFNTKQYRNWLKNADLSLIAYNFDEKSIAYTRYSMANKMPECLAAGRPVLVYGPEEVATVSYLKSVPSVFVQSDDKPRELANLIKKIAKMPEADLTAAGDAGRDYVFTRHNLETVKADFVNKLITAAKDKPRNVELVPESKIYLDLMAASEPEAKSPAKENALAQKAQRKVSHLRKFYSSWRLVPAALILLLPALAAQIFGGGKTLAGVSLTALALAVAGACALILIGFLYTLIVEVSGYDLSAKKTQRMFDRAQRKQIKLLASKMEHLDKSLNENYDRLASVQPAREEEIEMPVTSPRELENMVLEDMLAEIEVRLNAMEKLLPKDGR